MKLFLSTLFALLIFQPLQAQKVVKIIAETFPNGATKVLEYYEGVKSEGTLIRRETMTAGGVKVAEEKFYLGKRNGKAIKWDPYTENMTEEFYYDQGILEGEQKQWYSDGKKKAVYRYSKGKPHGEQFAWLMNEKERLHLNFATGIYHGMQREWFDDGSVRYNLNFVAGKLDGLQRWFEIPESSNPNRAKTEEKWKQGQYEEVLESFNASRPKHTRIYTYEVKDPTTYQNPAQITVEGTKKEIKEIIYHETGSIQTLTTMGDKPTTQQFYKTGKKMAEGPGTVEKRQGTWIWYHENGEKMKEGNFASGNKSGTFTTWNDQGKIVSEEVFTGLGEQKDSWKIWDYYGNGAIATEGQLDNKGRKDGKWIHYYENKSKKREEIYKLMCRTPGARPFAVRITEWDHNNVKSLEGSEREFIRYTYFDNGNIATLTRILRPYHENCTKKTFETFKDGKMVKDEYTVDSKTGENVEVDFERILRHVTMAESGDTLKVEQYNELGQLDGPQKGWYEGGKPHYEFTYANGKPGGPVQEWYPNGQIMLDLIYQNVGNRVLEVKRGTYYADNGKSWEYTQADGKSKKKKIVEIEEAAFFTKFLAENK